LLSIASVALAPLLCAVAGCADARTISSQATHGSMDAIRDRDPELVQRAHEDLRADPTVRGIARRATEGVLEAARAALPTRGWVAQTLAETPRRWVEGIDVAGAETRVRRAAQDALDGIDAAAQRWIASAESATRRALADLDLARVGRDAGTIAARVGSELGKAFVAEVRAELPPARAGELLAGVTETTRIIAAAVTRGVLEETRRQVEEGQRWTLGEKVALGIGIAAGVLIALVIGRSVERLRLELHRAMDRVAELERQRRAAKPDGSCGIGSKES
jgi:hypothetical protein